MPRENFQPYIKNLRNRVDQYIEDATNGQANNDQTNNLLEECEKAFDACNLRYTEIKKNFVEFYRLYKTIQNENDLQQHISKIQKAVNDYEILGNSLELLDVFRKLDGSLNDETIKKMEPIRNEIISLRRMMITKLPRLKKLFDQSDRTLDEDESFDAEQYTELEKKAKTEFSKCIENGTIDSISIKKDKDGDNFCAEIKLETNNQNIKISEFLNNKFCTNNKITGFSLSNSTGKKIINGYVDDKGVRCYDLSTIAPYQMQFKWYIGEKECSITLTTNSVGSVIIEYKGSTELKDLQVNKDVNIKVGDNYLSFADIVQKIREQQVSSQLSQPASQNSRKSSISDQ